MMEVSIFSSSAERLELKKVPPMPSEVWEERQIEVPEVLSKKLKEGNRFLVLNLLPYITS
jgi:hypothetical protein